MKKKKLRIFLLFLIFMILGCGGKPPAPFWISMAASRLEQFKSEYLGGRMDIAEMNFGLAVEEIKKSGDMDILGKAYLTKMALDVAVLRPAKNEDFLTLQRFFPSAQNESYYAFLQGRWAEVNPKYLPEAYHKFALACLKEEGKIAAIIGEIKDPLSRLIASGIYLAWKGDNEEILQMGVDTSSRQGWKRALKAYLERLGAYYEKMGKTSEAEKVRARLTIIGP
ncbi:MAG: hypothetical protein N2572_02355 [Syntrophales bacterium]|nr:hypothetical protein [Syntrophales bacterium]